MYLILKSSFHYVITFNVMLLFSYMSQEIITLKGLKLQLSMYIVHCTYLNLFFQTHYEGAQNIYIYLSILL